jgi:hypothetical protein
MSSPVVIYVEGIADIKFIKDFVKHHFRIELAKEDIIDSGGWTNIKSQKANGEMIRNKMTSNTDNGGFNLVIFDADSDYAARKKEITEWGAINGLTFELFLFPNNSNTGALEELLENIIQPNNAPIFECWDQYETCLNTKTIKDRGKPLTLPAKKTKIYGYLEALLGPSKSEKEKIKERERDYVNKNLWVIDSNYLDPLKTFLYEKFK